MTGECVTVHMMLSDISGLQGLWRRSLLAWPDRASDTTTNVRWLQGLRAYIDLRQPRPIPDVTHARALADLSLDDCLWLARQEGFAGDLRFDGAHFEWARTIDFQPRAAYADAGSLWWEDEVLIEKGRDAEYIEHWHRESSAPTLPICCLGLRATDRNTNAALLRVGANFMFARNRDVNLETQHRSLSECVAAASSLQHARELVNCEISFGRVDSGAFHITASTLPYRVGAQLQPQVTGRSVTTRDRASDGADVSRGWEITVNEGELDAFDIS
jgi:hypothetical protein